MAHDHAISDSDTHFLIDPVTREMTTEYKKLYIMQGDHNSECYTFEIPRYIDEHDMSLCDRVEVHYINISKDRQSESRGVYICNLVNVSEDTVLYDWVISRKATEYVGSMNFLIKFICDDEDGNVAYLWQTDIFTKVNVSESIDNTETAIEDTSDILEKWKQEVIDSIEVPEPDLTGYATETYVDEKVAGIDIPVIPTNVSAFTNDAGYITEVPEVDFTGYATETYVDEKVAGIDIPEVDFTGYATETYVNEAIAGIDIPEVDLTGYATETYVNEAIAGIDIPEGATPDWNAVEGEAGYISNKPTLFSGNYSDLLGKPAPDWNESGESSVNYIKNRIAYDYFVNTGSSSTITCSSTYPELPGILYYAWANNSSNGNWSTGSDYKVTNDASVCYISVKAFDTNLSLTLNGQTYSFSYYAGNLSIVGAGDDTGEPMLYLKNSSSASQPHMFYKTGANSIQLRVQKGVRYLKQLDESMIPDSIATKTYVDSKIGSGSGSSSFPSTEYEMLETVVSAGLIQPVGNAAGDVFTNRSGAVYTF